MDSDANVHVGHCDRGTVLVIRTGFILDLSGTVRIYSRRFYSGSDSVLEL